jgi:hypothetical protein
LFRTPLRRDPLVVGWALVMLVAALVALNSNTTWSGHLEADRVGGFLKDLAEAFLWSFFVLLFLAWIRAKGWGDTNSAVRGPKPARRETFEPYPWTDRWLRDSREAEAQGRASGTAEPSTLPVVCRHGVPVDTAPPGQPPVLRALAAASPIVPPGAEVSVTWCFEHAHDVVVDGWPGYPSCGEARVRIDATRRIEVVGRNRYGVTPAATPAVVAMTMPKVSLPSVQPPPPVTLQVDVAAAVAAPSAITQQLDGFWATQDALRPRPAAPAGLVGVPSSLVDRLRRTGRPKEQ